MSNPRADGEYIFTSPIFTEADMPDAGPYIHSASGVR